MCAVSNACQTLQTYLFLVFNVSECQASAASRMLFKPKKELYFKVSAIAMSLTLQHKIMNSEVMQRLERWQTLSGVFLQIIRLGLCAVSNACQTIETFLFLVLNIIGFKIVDAHKNL